MTEPIVVGVDASAPSRAAAEWAAGDARLRGLPLRVVRIEGAGAIAAVLASRASIIVLGLRGEDGVPVPAVGSVIHEVAARSDLPVVLVPAGGHGPVGGEWRTVQVVLSLDARNPVSPVVDFAFDAARRRGARLHAIHTWRLPPFAERWMPYALPEEDRGAWEDQEVQLLSDALRPWREKYPHVDVYEDVRLQIPSAALVRASASAELLVVGRPGRTLGPTLRAVLEHTACPVAVVPD
ncbi:MULTISPECIES: universal stress protein [unclassified Streptomyces]|uniref:universal stress protein n=1 Tax=unclassified Streptomyces TaxID=2593676 RepID=UPI0011CDD560|nr:MULTISPECIES: universal stress protein [unclassified Streptomyces]TXS78993.1 universal stress protein [Streptomyces sp. me109]